MPLAPPGKPGPKSRREKRDTGSGHSFDTGMNCAASCSEWGNMVDAVSKTVVQGPVCPGRGACLMVRILGLLWQQNEIQTEDRARRGKDTA